MKPHLNLLLIVSFLFCASTSSGQDIKRFNSFSYNVNEGLLQSNILDMEFDKNNFCWLSFANGIQKFDGKNFTVISIQSGLPDDKWVNFFRCSNGDLLVSHSQGISKYEITGNRFIQVYNNMPARKTPVLFIGEDDNTIYFYTEAGSITGIDCRTLKVISEANTGLPAWFSNAAYQPTISDNIINHKVALLVNSTLYLWDLQKRKILYKSAFITNVSIFFLVLKTESEVLYYNNKNNINLKLHNFPRNTSTSISIKQKSGVKTFRSIIYSWQNRILFSCYNNLYETDENFQEIKSKLVNFQNQPIAGNTSIARIKEDNFGNLYLVTISDGFKKIIRNNYPIKYYGTEKKEDNYIVSILPNKKDNRILAGTYGNGLLVFDTLQHLIKHIKKLPGTSHSFSPSVIIKTNKGDYVLFIYGENCAWKLSNDFSEISSIKISTSLPEDKSGIGYFGNFLFQNEREAVIQTGGRLYKTSFTGNTVTENEVTSTYTMSGLLYNSFIIIHTNDELIFLDAVTFKEQKKIPFKNTGAVRCFAKDAANNIYIGSNKGVFKIDSTGKILLHLTKENGLPDECIYAMVIDNEGYLWCSTNKGVFKINRENSLLQLNKEDGLQENEFNTNVAAMAEDGEVFFGGVNGISSFYPSALKSIEEKINILFTNIKINNKESFKDTAVSNIATIDLPYNQNTLAFDFIAMAGNNPAQYIYQYKMEGIDDQWIQNNDLQTVRYFLPPGKYVFKVYASRFFNNDAKPLKEIVIRIYPPFWKTWWFLTGLTVLLIAGLAYAINQYNRKKYKKKLMELKSEHKIQMERERISRDLHDNIGAYANAVLYKTDLLQKAEAVGERNELMNDLKFASKDIITSLRETIWALKKEQYTAQECLLRIRNFIQPFNRYYPHIHFLVQGEVSSSMNLHYTRALNLVRIVQEAISNAIKHASAANITVASSMENGKWKLVITDDGIGFDYAGINELQQGNGLNNMKQRSVDGGFDFTINSMEHKGTTITFYV